MNDLERIGRALADAGVWLTAVLLTLGAAFTQPLLMAPWFIVGYAAHRILPKPAASGIRGQVWMGMVMSAIIGAAVFHSWGPLVWFAAGWAAFAATFNPED